MPKVSALPETATMAPTDRVVILSDADGGTPAVKTIDGIYLPPSLIVPSVKTVSYTLVLADGGTALEMDSASALVLTVPLNATVPYPIGTVIEVARMGAGAVTLAATGGVTIQSPGGKLALRMQFSTASLRKRATDTWLLTGDLA